MDIPITLQSGSGVAILALIIGMLLWMHLRRPRAELMESAGPPPGYAYEWVATPLTKARQDLKDRFPELDSVLGDDAERDVYLGRFGLFNMTEDLVGSDRVSEPVEIHFSDRTIIVSARFGEALKTAPKGAAEPTVDGGRVHLPPETMNPKSTLIYNFILRGHPEPVDVSGSVEGYGTIRRVS